MTAPWCSCPPCAKCGTEVGIPTTSAGDLGGAHLGEGDCGETTWATREELLAGPYGPVVARIFGVLDAVPPGGAP